MGQIICVMMRNQLAVWGGVCGRVVCVCVCHTRALSTDALGALN